MNKLVLTCAAVALAISANAQEISNELGKTGTPIIGLTSSEGISRDEAAKTTGLTDTLLYSYAQQTTGPFSGAFWDANLPVDSGRLYGNNTFGTKAAAQLYRYSSIDAKTPADTTYNIYGVYALFSGTAKTASKSISINIWKRDANKYALTGVPKWYIYGVPQTTTVASKTVAYPSIQMGSLARYFFTTPITGVNYDLYAGYSLPAYTYTNLGGDTVGLATSEIPANGSSGTRVTETGTLDTLVSVNTLFQNSSNQWKSAALEAGGRVGNIVLFPIIKLSCATCTGGNVGVANFTANDLKFFGNTPNPALNYTDVKFALKSATGVTIYVTDITGKNVRTIKENNLSIGEHSVRIETADLAAGSYTYLVVTGKGDGVASQLTVIK